MHVIIDAVTVEPKDHSGLAGIGRYTQNMIRWLPRVSKEDRFTVCLPAWASDVAATRSGLDADNVSFIKPFGNIPFVSRHLFLPMLGFLKRADVWFSPHGQIPFGWRKRAVITVHDLSILDHPGWFPEGEGEAWSTRMAVPASFRRADRIIAVSEFTKQQISNHFPEAVKQTHVVYEGLDMPESFNEIHTKTTQEDIVLFIGTVEPRKNLVKALEAFNQFLVAHPDRANETSFYIAGKKGWKHEQVEQKIREINAAWEGSSGEGVVKYLGYISDQEKWSLLQRAQVLFFPSLEEGFGLPVLEAMGTGTPVVTSQRGAIPEIAGETAFYIDPQNVEQMALTLAQCLLLPEGVSGMSQQAKERAQTFRWEDTAKETLKILRSAVEVQK